MRWREIRRLLARKAELTPGMVMGSPGAPFPWRTVPYVHGVFPPNASYANGAITTDDLGLRRTEINGELLGFRQFQRLPGEKKLLIGASVAFSMGCSSDRTTIASQLSRLSHEPWFALAIPSYVSTQELLLYLLLNPQEITEIAILSGLNTLSASILNPRGVLDEIFSPNFFTEASREATTLRATLTRYLRRAVGRLRHQRRFVRHRLRVESESVQLALSLLQRDLEVLTAICQARDIRVTFFSPPLLRLLKKPLTDEEAEISRIEETLGQLQAFTLWDLYCDLLVTWYPAYCRSLEEICRVVGIGYHDFNQDTALRDSHEWLFADQVHFTDRGALICAERMLDVLSPAEVQRA